jgi:hypothetical protein
MGYVKKRKNTCVERDEEDEREKERVTEREKGASVFPFLT